MPKLVIQDRSNYSNLTIDPSTTSVGIQRLTIDIDLDNSAGSSAIETHHIDHQRNHNIRTIVSDKLINDTSLHWIQDPYLELDRRHVVLATHHVEKASQSSMLSFQHMDGAKRPKKSL